MADKKDILEMDFRKVSVPDAIVLSMQAATKCVVPDFREHVVDFDNDRLRDLVEKLEGRVQDELDDAAKATAPAPEEEEMYPAASEDDVYINKLNDEVYQVIHKGVVFGRFCNEPVEFDHDTGQSTHCIKQWAHRDPTHEDSEGGHRL